MDLVTTWYALVVLAWVLFFVLEGFDFGVGILTPLLGRDDHERGAATRTIGPFWDGNEVWLVAAVGLVFAAFPAWYAALLSGLYLPVVLVLLLLAGRGVAVEFRAKGPDARWRARCDAVHALTSAGIVALWGALLAVFAGGLPIGPDGEVTAGPGVLGGLRRSVDPLLTPAAGAGAALALAVAVALGATFLGLRTTGPLRTRARRVAVVAVPLAAAGLAAVPLGAGRAAGAALAVAAVAVLARREAVAFALTALGTAGAVVAVFAVNGVDGVLLPSTLDPAYALTLDGAAASEGALRLISTVGVVAIPGVLVYQAVSYVVFRRRVASDRVPA